MDETTALVEKILKEIAASLKLEFAKYGGMMRGDTYSVGNISFTKHFDPRTSTILIVTRDLGSFGPYNKEALLKKAKNEIFVKVVESMKKQKK